MPTAEQLDAQYENDDLYEIGIPVISDARLVEIYKSAGIDGKTGLAVGKVVNGGPIVISASTHALKQAALQCGCPSCESALLAIESSVKWRCTASGQNIKRARANRRYFIQRLREVVFSTTVNHNQK